MCCLEPPDISQLRARSRRRQCHPYPHHHWGDQTQWGFCGSQLKDEDQQKCFSQIRQWPLMLVLFTDVIIWIYILCDLLLCSKYSKENAKRNISTTIYLDTLSPFLAFLWALWVGSLKMLQSPCFSDQRLWRNFKNPKKCVPGNQASASPTQLFVPECLHVCLIKEQKTIIKCFWSIACRHRACRHRTQTLNIHRQSIE